MTMVAAICRGIWCTRNKATFDNCIIRSSLEAVFTVCSFLMYWSGLLKGIDKERVQAGVQKMVRVAASLADRSTPGEGSCWGMAWGLEAVLDCSL